MAALPPWAGPAPEARAGEAAEPREVLGAPRSLPEPPGASRDQQGPTGTPPAVMAGLAQWQEPVTFEDVTVFLSRAEWDALAVGQQELYRDVVSDTYELLTSLGYPGPKPDILHRLERGEAPWICPSPGHVGSWLEEPPSDWWLAPSRCQGLEEGPEPSCPAGQSTSWCLEAGSLLESFSCLEERSEFLMEADSGVGSQTQPWFVKEEVEDKPGLTEILTQSGTFPLRSMLEQQNVDPWEQIWDNPGERNHGNTQNHGYTLGEATLLPGNRELRVEELRAAMAKDHSYCLRSEPAPPCAPRVCFLWDHSYCRERRAGKCRRPHGAGAAQAACCRLAQRRSRLSSKVHKARQILRRYRPYRRLGFPRRGCSVCRPWAQGIHPGGSLPTAPGDLGSAGNAEGVTSDTRRTPDGSLGTGASPPAPILAAGASKGARPPEDLGVNQDLQGRVESRKSQAMSLHKVFQNVLRTVRYLLDSMCQRFEVQGFSPGKSIWPIVIQIDNLAEVGNP